MPGSGSPHAAPVAGAGAVLALVGGVLGAKLGGGDTGDVVRSWAGRLREKSGSPDFVVGLGPKKVLLVTGRELSERMLAAPPDEAGIMSGTSKVGGMSFLAPGALTIRHGGDWSRLRAFNEAVLCPGRAHRYEQAFHERVSAAFDRPVRSVPEIREAMASAMLDIVFGPGVVRPGVGDDVQLLFGLVKKPLRRKLTGFLHRKRRQAFFDGVADGWRRARTEGATSLVAMAAEAHPEPTPEILEQVPHWMFTFTGSGTDLLARTLAMITSRPEVYERVAAELEAAGPLEDAPTIHALDYLHACVLETGRLFPPVTLAFHRIARDSTLAGVHLPAGLETVHYIPLFHRDRSVDASADDFRPERWSDGGNEDTPFHFNLFLSGVRMCPGRDLIVFVCKSAIARLVGRWKVSGGDAALRKDPLPVSFPVTELRLAREAAGS